MTTSRVDAFSGRINPRNFNFSPMLVAIVGAIIGHDYGVRDGRGGYLKSLSITSDGFVMAASTAHETGALLCDADELVRNLRPYLAELQAEDHVEFRRRLKSNVTSYWTRAIASEVL